MPRREPQHDPRLIGTWQSDRRRTFRHFKPKAGCRPASLLKLKRLFGKLVIEWGRTKYTTELDGVRSTARYRVVARDTSSVVVAFADDLTGGAEVLRQIHFHGDHYMMPTGGSLVEWFRRVGVSPPRP